MTVETPSGTARTLEQIKEHYEIEKELANKLRTSSQIERQQLYTALYDELFQRIPHHPQLVRQSDAVASKREVKRKMRLLKQVLRPDTVFLEVGPGDCRLSLAVAQQVKQVYAIDVSQEVAKHVAFPANCELMISDGCTIPVPENSVTVAYSNQLMEHLHPDDAFNQLRHLYQAIAPGGVYVCITPNRLSGPHDVSQHFDEVATGFHLKEYTHTEMAELLTSVGFSKLTTYIGGKGVYIPFPFSWIKWVEKALNQQPFSRRKTIARTLPVKALLGVIVMAKK